MIETTIRAAARKRNIEVCRKRGIVLPTLEEQKHPERLDAQLRERIRKVGLWDVDPLNLFRITWKNEPTLQGGGFGGVNYVEFPPELTGVPARIIGLVGRWFPTGAHKVGATYGCLVPALVSGGFDSTAQKAVWPSTGNYCRGGAYNSALLGCESVAILPEGMSRERFEWLKNVAGEVIATPGTESNVKEIFDACHALTAERGDEVVIFNQFDQFGNYLWHFHVTGEALLEIVAAQLRTGQDLAGFVASTGSSGTLAAGDRLKDRFPAMKIAAAEALQCPTLLENGFGEHRLEGIGDKHIPWVHNVRNTDMAIAVDDEDAMQLLRLYNEPEGRRHLEQRGVAREVVEQLDAAGISGVGNIVAAAKMARYYELSSDDVILTVLTDSMDLYQSRLDEVREAGGELSAADAERIAYRHIEGLRTDSMIETTYRERRRIHNLKYYTWVEQQGKDSTELERQWYEKDYWRSIQAQAEEIDEMIQEFNAEVLGS
jgi:cysteine synthase